MGAVDARAISNLLNEEIELGFSKELKFDFDNENFQKHMLGN